jgi:3-ketosteroid 9alpha-monooxygenase subunit B
LRIVHRLDDPHGMLDEAAVRELAAGRRDASFYVCGPAPFMELVQRALSAAGVSDEHVRVERFVFTPHAHDAAPAAPDGAEVPELIEIHLEGKPHRVPYVPGKTLLQTARDAGLNAPYSCEEGFCGCCASDLLEGRVVMAADDALSAEERRKGMILACQSRPVTRRCTFRFVG